jgi:LysM repeat protein
MTGQAARFFFLLCLVLGLSGCVSKENYNREVNRANNFQRLLAEEEKRNAELVAEIARLKSQATELEAKGKTLTAQLNEAKAQVVRSLEEVGHLQDEIKQARARVTMPPNPSTMPQARGVSPTSTEPPDRLDELQTNAAPFFLHEVKTGETLDGIAKRYKITVQTLRELNDLAAGDNVKPGDRLIVGQKP